MVNRHTPDKQLWAVFTVLFLMFLCPSFKAASSEPLSNVDLEACDPVKLTSTIMEIDPENNMLVVAEKEIMIVDTTIAAERFITDLADIEGKAIPLERFAPGRSVRIDGLILPDGRILASRVQEVTRTRAGTKAGTQKKPILKTMRTIKPVR